MLLEAFAAGGGPTASPVFGTAGTHRASTTASPAFAVPASVAANDIIIVPIYLDSATVTVTAFPTGFALHPDFPYTASGIMNHRVMLAWKRATGADSGTYTFTLSSSLYSAGAALRYTGCKLTGTPFDVPSGGDTPLAQDTTNGTVTPGVNVTTLGAFRTLLHIGTNWTGGTWTAPSAGGTWNKRMDGNDHIHILSDRALASAGNSGSVTASCTGSDKRTGWIGALIGA
jgi:hypothetical protein